MTGITLDVEQIRNAPAPVRQWIEQQVSGAFGLGRATEAVSLPPHLKTCTPAQAAAVLDRIRNLRSAAAVFFEFGRPGICYGHQYGKPSAAEIVVGDGSNAALTHLNDLSQRCALNGRFGMCPQLPASWS